jgi:hypothetical protein
MEAEWEESKENFQPLKAGRDPHKLSCSTSQKELNKKTEQERR